ncbi:MAG: NAD(P)H-hydrate dehydratase [Actinomycetota bacterium]
MIPVVTPKEMNQIDLLAPEPIDELIQRAGIATAWRARQIMKGTYGKRVVVLIGKGNNGADGRVAADHLSSWGVKVQIVTAEQSMSAIPSCDLLIDAAYGTGLKREYVAPVSSYPVLAVDIPSGICGLTGEALGEPIKADSTITFQAMKPGHLLSPGSIHCGDISIADIGLDVSKAQTHVVEKSDIMSWLPKKKTNQHKWASACWVVGGSPGMSGAPFLASRAAQRSGSGYVRMSVPGGLTETFSEVVGFPIPETKWEEEITLSEMSRFHSMILGPGLGRSKSTIKSVQKVISTIKAPMVLDGDALFAIGKDFSIDQDNKTEIILTPHDQEYEYITGHRPGKNRIKDVQEAAQRMNVILLLKGPVTIIGNPDGRCFVVTSGDQRLATAGTGDILSGIIGGMLAQGVAPLEAATIGAWVHGQASKSCAELGMIASDLLKPISEVLNETYVG